LKVNHDRLT